MNEANHQSLISQQHIQSFCQRGFITLPSICNADEIAWFSRRYDDIVTAIVGCKPAEIARISSLAESHVFERSLPLSAREEFAQTGFYRRARALVAALSGADDSQLRCGWRLFFKLSGFGETFWHQDAAYRPEPFDSITVWMPLEDANLDSGCMHYLPHSHRNGLHPHRRQHGHLTVDTSKVDLDLAQAHAYPVPAGGCTIHHCCTVHYASANAGPGPRRALALVCARAALAPELARRAA